MAHRPAASATARPYTSSSSYRAYQETIARAIAATGVRVHLMLAGHDHTLAGICPPAPNLPLTVVAGSGSKVGEYATGSLSAVTVPSVGFSRIDVVETPTEDRLYRRLGLDLVGKTAGPEFRLARMYGMCLGIVSIVVNPAEGLGEFEHADLRSIYRRCGPTMARLVIEALADADQATSAPRCTCIDEPGASLFREFAPHARYGGDRPHG